MPDLVQPAVDNTNLDSCTRCLQPVPAKVARCPGCGHPISRKARWLPLLIGVIGILAITFAMLIMYRTVAEEDAGKAPVATEDAGTDELFPDPPPANSPKTPAKPEKKPPLNEK